MIDSRDLFDAVPRSQFDVPGRSGGLLDVFRWHYLLRLLVRTGVTTRYRNSVLGWTWSYVRPAAQFLVFFIVLGVFLNLNHGIPNYAIYLFSGIVVINLFSEGFKNATTSIVNNAALVRKVYLPRQLFAVSAVIVAFVHFLPQVALLVIVCLFFGWIANLTVLAVLAIFAGMLLIMLFALGLGLLFGAMNVRFRDAENIVELLLLLATWASPVLYYWTMVADVLPGWLLEIYMLNPITQAVELFHFAFWNPITPDSAELPLPPMLAINTLWTYLIAIASILIGQAVFRRLEGRFAQDL
ncbi:ABC transporter permease [Microbacterium sp. Root180]|jgi:ABC-2 type transport system permease protein|uniref:ABC transporter permease n=1 Tax=Microbacterium sp. Root180 TaxID=1736483 RepID=UPI0006F2056F|nr:ABC transporter permease [Microbacterium sp. Root180]KRB36284.1 sugar ABC transporter permease [Microbacterium sp. Root180]